MKRAACVATLALAVTGRAWSQAPTIANASQAEYQEQAELSRALSEAGNSAVEIIRALEQYLKKYPQSKQRLEIEKALVKSAIELNDSERIIRWGEVALAKLPPPDLQTETTTILDRTIRALVDHEDPDRAKRALALAKRFESDIEVMRSRPAPGHLTPGQWTEELDKATARALELEARATGFAGSPEEAVLLAKKSWQAYPTGEGASEVAYWLSRTGHKQDSIEFFADSFALEDPRTTEADRARDRARLGEIYRELHGSEKGLGDVVLEAYDRTTALLESRRSALKAKDPNAVAVRLRDFTLPAVDAGKPALSVASLKGKTIVMDFWATWCTPCRAQKPMIENVSRKYANAQDVIFLPVNSDDEPGVVPQFVREQGWKDGGYFEAGLARNLTISSIPTVIILDPSGRISSRMVGFIPERFEEMLAERIDDARRVPPAAN